ncbi:MAG: response regulator transcription factor [Lysinibacillus sp.]
MRKILLVDDDVSILKLLATHFHQWHYNIIIAKNGQEALDIMDETVDIAVVDVMMPLVNGLALTKILKEDWEIPVLLLTARGQLEDKRAGFMAGADDYIVKPFEPEELLFRVQAILRRYDKLTQNKIECGDLVLNRNQYEVTKGKISIVLPNKEFELLAILCGRNRVFERIYLMEQVWGDLVSDDTLNTHIKRLRDKLTRLKSAVKIKTIRNVGYQIEVENANTL